MNRLSLPAFGVGAAFVVLIGIVSASGAASGSTSAASGAGAAVSVCKRVGVRGVASLPKGTFAAVSAAPDGDIWAVGSLGKADNPLIFRVRRGRLSRMPLPPLPRTQFGYDLRGVVAPATDAAWAVGQDVVLRWDGHRWRRANAPRGVYDAVDASSPHDVWAAGIYVKQANGHVLSGFRVVHWNGTTWQRVPSPSLPGASAGGSTFFTYLYSVLALGPDSVWVVGGRPAFAAHWDGSEWTSYSMPTPDADGKLLDSVAGRPPQNVNAAGDAGDFEWSNGAWVPLNYRLFHNYYTGAITVRGGTLWGVSGGNDVRVVRLSGSTWVSAGKVLPDTEWSQITIDGHGDAWAVGTHWKGAPWYPAIVHYQC